MTSANFFNGYANDKPTSRVLNPPGGRSNNIFGTSAADEAREKDNIVKQEALANKTNRNESSTSMFSGAGEPIAHRDCHKSGSDRQKSSIFEEEVNRVGNPRQAKRTGYNPITGKSYEDEEEDRRQLTEKSNAIKADKAEKHDAQPHLSQSEQPAAGAANPIHTSSRVLQPPGGRSTKLW